MWYGRSEDSFCSVVRGDASLKGEQFAAALAIAGFSGFVSLRRQVARLAR